jgi:hypothetical protein
MDERERERQLDGVTGVREFRGSREKSERRKWIRKRRN